MPACHHDYFNVVDNNKMSHLSTEITGINFGVVLKVTCVKCFLNDSAVFDFIFKSIYVIYDLSLIHI